MTAVPIMPVVALVYLNTTMAFQMVSFLLLVVFLNKKLFRPMLAYLDKRAQTIKHELDKARTTNAEAETDREEARHELDGARRESYEIRTQAREIVHALEVSAFGVQVQNPSAFLAGIAAQDQRYDPQTAEHQARRPATIGFLHASGERALCAN